MVWLSMLALAGATELWQQPPDPIAAMLDAQAPPGVTISPDKRWLVEVSRPSLPSLADLARPKVKLAGLSIDPVTRGPADPYAWTGLTVRPVDGGPARTIALPAGTQLLHLQWSPDSRALSFSKLEDDGIALWVVTLEDGVARAVSKPVLHGGWGSPCAWLSSSDALLCSVRPTNEPPVPQRAALPAGPTIEENISGAKPARTYQNLLADEHDEQTFIALGTSAVARIGLDGSSVVVAEPDLYVGVEASPDGAWLMLATLARPFSRSLPASRFPQTFTVRPLAGGPAVTLAEVPLADSIPIAFGSVRTGRRNFSWRPDRPATLVWVEALDGGDASKPADLRDKVMQLDAPFTADAAELWRTELRYSGMDFAADGTAVGYESWYTSRQRRMWLLPSVGEARLIFEGDSQDAYASPGYPITAPGPYGEPVLHRTASGDLILSGGGASPDGVHPFLDRLDVNTLAKRRIWQSADPYYERPIAPLDSEARTLLTQRQSQREPANYGVRTGKKWRQLTRMVDHAPELAGVGREVITTTRADGVQLSATLFTPPGYRAKRDGPLPLLLWAYPLEFRSAASAAQVTTSRNLFSRPSGSSALFLLTQGYAVLMDPTMPIVGEGDVEPNDTYVEQLVASAQAHIDEVVRRGVASADRVAIGGHSYGAFTVANLLAHSDLFKAGIARSGAYNRTLTPFGFQGEQRTFWQSTDVYLKMMPFAHAQGVNQPILLIHGAEDSNPGTFPMQSKRMYEAIKGHGGTARWVELPLEEHGYRSREAVGHVLWEMDRWLARYLKGEVDE